MSTKGNERGRNVYLVTGANAGLGKDTCRQLATLSETSKIYMACRSSAKASQAIDDLVQNHGCPAEKLQFYHFDANETKQEIDQTVQKSFVSSIRFTAILLNAGGPGDDPSLKGTYPNGVLPIVQLNVIGHIQLVQALYENKHLPDGCRIIFSGSESARGIPMFLSPSPTMGDTVQDVKDFITGTRTIRMDLIYGHTKGIGTLYFAALGRRHPEWKIYTVSPGGTMGTKALHQTAIPWIFAMIVYVIWTIAYWLGRFQMLEDGASKYVQVICGELDDKKYPNGSFLACSVDLAGPLCEQASICENARQYNDEQKQEVVYEALQVYISS